jgi:hypothetical protein
MLEVMRAMTAGYEDYKVLMIDSLDGAYDMMLHDWMTANQDKSRVHALVASQPDYLVATSRFRAFLAQIARAPFTILATCHKQEFMDAARLTYIKPSMTGKLAGEVSEYFDFVGFLYSRAIGQNKVEYFAQFSSFGRTDAKERTPEGQKTLGPVLSNPSMRTIYDVINRDFDATHAQLSKLDGLTEDTLAELTAQPQGGATIQQPQ